MIKVVIWMQGLGWQAVSKWIIYFSLQFGFHDEVRVSFGFYIQSWAAAVFLVFNLYETPSTFWYGQVFLKRLFNRKKECCTHNHTLCVIVCVIQQLMQSHVIVINLLEMHKNKHGSVEAALLLRHIWIPLLERTAPFLLVLDM